MRPPDVVLLAVEWRPRALIRAQLIEEGFEVVATNTWPMMRRHLRPGVKPRLALVDLQDLREPANILNALRVLMKPDRVLVLTAIGTVPQTDVEHMGFHVLARPIEIDRIVRAVADVIGSTSTSQQ
jgi:DNA-binding NtrC family response regulator